MTLNEYQKKAMSTCMPSCNNFSYMALNLVGEVGEFASKVAKAIRKGHISIEYDELIPTNKIANEVLLTELQAEAGDIL